MQRLWGQNLSLQLEVCLIASSPEKCLKCCVNDQVVTYMNENKFFHTSQHGYRSHHSTTTAMLSIHDSWVEAVDSRSIVGVALCDMSAAFDVVDTQLLLDTCSQFGFDWQATQWLWSYLNNISHSVYISGCLSTSLQLEVGLHQGSILGPLLYSIFTSAFPETVHSENCPSRRTTENKAPHDTQHDVTTVEMWHASLMIAHIV